LFALAVAPVAGASAASGAAGWKQGANLPNPYVTHWDTASSYFPRINGVVTFGGSPKQLSEAWSNETWIFSNTTKKWSQGPAAPSGLTPRGGSAMAFDPDLGDLVLFGGAGSSWPPLNETWLFDGTSWTQGPAAPAGLAGRTGAEMAYDKSIGAVVLFGGSGAEPFDDTWFLTGTTPATLQWTPGPAAPAAMGPRAFFGMTYDDALGDVVVAGGDGGTDCWFLTGDDMSSAQWVAAPPFADKLGTRERFRLAYDPQLGGDALFGGLKYSGDSDFWVLVNGTEWVQIPRSGSWPSGRLDGSLVWNPTYGSGALMLFAGISPNQNGKVGFSDTWFYKGSPPTPTGNQGTLINPGFPGPAPDPYDPPTGPATGVVTAHDNQFFVDGDPIIFKGGNDLVPASSTIASYAALGMNLIRLRIHYAEIEPNPPQLVGGQWVHSYNETYIQSIITYIRQASDDGLYTILDMHGCSSTRDCGYFRVWPLWTTQAQYNSKNTTYPQTPQGKQEACADFWSDSMRMQFFADMWQHVASETMDEPGIAGYEIQNEPNPGLLPNAQSTTTSILGAQYSFAQSIRAVDPSHVLFFTTREDYGPGLMFAGSQLQQFEDLGNVAFDLHEYFGARWGVGLDLLNPRSQTYDEALGSLYSHVATGAAGGQWPYIGSTFEVVRYLQSRVQSLEPYGIPVVVGELGDPGTDEGVWWCYATELAAPNYLGLSWTADSGRFGFLGQPWESLVQQAI
jgi:hypothetical protein